MTDAGKTRSPGDEPGSPRNEAHTVSREETAASPGTVYLVGAGPGDLGLLTLRAAELIAGADAIFHDRLIPVGALEFARSDAQLTYVGKTPRQEADKDGGTSQEEIIEQLIETAREGLSVVRLKGGDPFVFGRGGEEAAALRAAGIPFEVVPGVTAGVAGPAYAGIPVTHRGESGAVAFVTGHPAREEKADASSQPDMAALAAFPGTLVFYMGVRRLPANCEALIAAGRNPREPAAVIEAGTMTRQRVVTSDLGGLAAAAAEAGVRAPALVVIGDVTRHAAELAWFDPGPLAGRSVVVTRARAQAGVTAARFRALGAEVVELPAIRVESRVDQAEVGAVVDRLAEGGFDFLTLTSVNGVDFLFEALEERRLDARALAGVEIAAIGPATAAALADRGIRADHLPARAVTESLIDSLDDLELDGRRALVAGAAGMRPDLAEALVARGATAEPLTLYETVAEPVDPEDLEAVLAADFITLASASAARNLARALREGTGWSGSAESFPARGRVVSIGPITGAAAEEHGIPVHAEASPHTIAGLIAAIERFAEL